MQAVAVAMQEQGGDARLSAIATLMTLHPGIGSQVAWLHALEKTVRENPGIDEGQITGYWLRLSNAGRLVAVMNPLLGLVLQETECY